MQIIKRIEAMEGNKKVVIYCRVSTQMQRTDRQEEELSKLAKEYNNWDVVGKYIDVISGFKAGEDRPQYNKLLQRIEKDKIDIIIFSELSRLGRNATDLLEQVETLNGKKIDLYFQKQNLWVKGEKDLGSKILLYVLAVMSEYEIELFAERSISGKISKTIAGGGCAGDSQTIGYRNNSAKKIVIDEETKPLVIRIFSMYANGASINDIATILNSEQILTPVARRILIDKEKRKTKGLDEKQYKYNPEELKWCNSVIHRILINELYTGKRHIVFHKPDPKNKIPKHLRKNREIIYEYEEQIEELRIISDNLFKQVQMRLEKSRVNKNNELIKPNLLKKLIKCGECGNNYHTRSSNKQPCYGCFGMTDRPAHPKVCTNGIAVQASKLDGLVIQLSLQMFADKDVTKLYLNKSENLLEAIKLKKKVLSGKEKELLDAKNEYDMTLLRLSKSKAISNEKAIEMINNESIKYQEIEKELTKAIEKIKQYIASSTQSVETMRNIDKNPAIKMKMDEIREDKDLLKKLVEEHIESITIYKIEKLWALVIINYKFGGEIWGTIKQQKYKDSELFISDLSSEKEYKTWIVVNLDNKFTYNKDNKTITCNDGSEYMQDVKPGTYTFNEFQKELERTNNIGSFPFYYYEKNYINKKEGIKQLETGNFHVDWKKHNEEVFKHLARKRNN